MRLTVKVPPGFDPVEYRQLGEAAVRGVRNLVFAHLVARDSAAKHAPGMPRSGYWGSAAASVTFSATENGGEISIPKEGVALHYYGGVVRPGPGKKALAFPVNPAVAGMRATEYDPMRTKLDFVPGRKGKAPTLRDSDSGDVYYVLLASKKFDADKTVLPSEPAMLAAAVSAMEAARC